MNKLLFIANNIQNKVKIFGIDLFTERYESEYKKVILERIKSLKPNNMIFGTIEKID